MPNRRTQVVILPPAEQDRFLEMLSSTVALVDLRDFAVPVLLLASRESSVATSTEELAARLLKSELILPIYMVRTTVKSVNKFPRLSPKPPTYQLFPRQRAL